MTLSPVRFGALAVCLAMSQHALANDDADTVALARNFVQALQQQRYADAAAMFAPQAGADIPATAGRLKRIDERIGGFATMQNVLSAPAGTSVKLAIPATEGVASTSKKFYQIRYTATSVDGKPVFYVLDIDGTRKPQQVLSFAAHLPTPDAQSAQWAKRIASGMPH